MHDIIFRPPFGIHFDTDNKTFFTDSPLTLGGKFINANDKIEDETLEQEIRRVGFQSMQELLTALENFVRLEPNILSQIYSSTPLGLQQSFGDLNNQVTQAGFKNVEQAYTLLKMLMLLAPGLPHAIINKGFSEGFPSFNSSQRGFTSIKLSLNKDKYGIQENDIRDKLIKKVPFNNVPKQPNESFTEYNIRKQKSDDEIKDKHTSNVDKFIENIEKYPHLKNEFNSPVILNNINSTDIHKVNNLVKEANVHPYLKKILENENSSKGTILTKIGDLYNKHHNEIIPNIASFTIKEVPEKLHYATGEIKLDPNKVQKIGRELRHGEELYIKGPDGKVVQVVKYLRDPKGDVIRLLGKKHSGNLVRAYEHGYKDHPTYLDRSIWTKHGQLLTLDKHTGERLDTNKLKELAKEAIDLNEGNLNNSINELLTYIKHNEMLDKMDGHERRFFELGHRDFQNKYPKHTSILANRTFDKDAELNNWVNEHGPNMGGTIHYSLGTDSHKQLALLNQNDPFFRELIKHIGEKWLEKFKDGVKYRDVIKEVLNDKVHKDKHALTILKDMGLDTKNYPKVEEEYNRLKNLQPPASFIKLITQMKPDEIYTHTLYELTNKYLNKSQSEEFNKFMDEKVGDLDDFINYLRVLKDEARTK